jgi:hypothetical protein
MAENDFLSGLLGGVKDAGSSIYGGISGLLGGGEQTPSAGGQMPDSMSMMSQADQRRLMFSTLGQVGAALLAAGARQSPESRAQALAQLGKIGPGIEESMQRNAALQQQRIAAQRMAELFPLQKQQLQGQIGAQEVAQQAAQRQNELFPLQKQQLQGQLGAQELSQGTAILGLMGQKTKLEQNIQTLRGLGMDTSAQQRQLDIYNQYITKMAPAGVQSAIGAPAAAAPMPTQTLPSMVQPSMPAVPQQASQETVMAPAPAPIAATELPAIPIPAATPAVPIQNQGVQALQQQFPYVPVQRAMSELTTGADVSVSMQKLMDLNEKNKSEQMKAEGDLRKEFNPKAERYNAIQTAYATLPSLKDLKSGVADHALILSYYKIFDPNSVVSSTESGQISASSNSISDSLQQRLNKALTGESLSPEMREKIYSAAKAKFMAEYDSYERAFGQARVTAKEFVDPNRAIPDVRDPQIMASVARERDLADISSKISANDVLTLGLEDIRNLDQSKMTKPARDATKARLDMLLKAAMVQPNVPVAEQPQQGIGGSMVPPNVLQPKQSYGLQRNREDEQMQKLPRALTFGY